MTEKKILDACCGSRMFWFNKKHPNAVYQDIRSESHILCDGRKLEISPDVVSDFRSMPYPDGSFKLVVFDPPHLQRVGDKSWLALKYGKLTPDWKSELKQGFSECFRVLEEDGILIFKWNEDQIKVSQILKLTDQPPLFGHTTGRHGKTHWITFMKITKQQNT